jgi:FtsH-binding integral membrane protein
MQNDAEDSTDELNRNRMSKTNPWNSQRAVLLLLTLALLAWGVYHAVGVYFGGFGNENLRHDFRRSLVVLACMAAFLGGWWWLMLAAKPKRSRTDRLP